MYIYLFLYGDDDADDDNDDDERWVAKPGSTRKLLPNA